MAEVLPTRGEGEGGESMEKGIRRIKSLFCGTAPAPSGSMVLFSPG